MRDENEYRRVWNKVGVETISRSFVANLVSSSIALIAALIQGRLPTRTEMKACRPIESHFDFNCLRTYLNVGRRDDTEPFLHGDISDLQPQKACAHFLESAVKLVSLSESSDNTATQYFESKKW